MLALLGNNLRVIPDNLMRIIHERQRIGYVRISTFDQNSARQLEQVQVDRIFPGKASGKDTKRPELEALLSFVREGDTIVVQGGTGK